MGTTGTGRFSDYSDASASKTSKSSGGGGSSADDVKENPCDTAFMDDLEEINRSQYFQQLHQLPNVKDTVAVQYKHNRLAVLDDKNGLIIGYLPTSRNYLRKCINDHARQYHGSVVIARILKSGIAEVRVSIVP